MDLSRTPPRALAPGIQGDQLRQRGEAGISSTGPEMVASRSVWTVARAPALRANRLPASHDERPGITSTCRSAPSPNCRETLYRHGRCGGALPDGGGAGKLAD